MRAAARQKPSAAEMKRVSFDLIVQHEQPGKIKIGPFDGVVL